MTWWRKVSPSYIATNVDCQALENLTVTHTENNKFTVPSAKELNDAMFIKIATLLANSNSRPMVDEGHRNYVIDKVADAVRTACNKNNWFTLNNSMLSLFQNKQTVVAALQLPGALEDMCVVLSTSLKPGID